MAGAALWILAPAAPPHLAGAGLFFGALAPALALSAWPSARPDGWGVRLRAGLAGLLAMAACVGLGAAAAEWRAARVAAPRLAAEFDGARLEGWVLGREMGTRPRLVILVRALEGAEPLPRTVRISAREIGDLDAGRPVRCRASLRPPDGPLAPGAYDFARRAYFERLGGVGFIWGRCRPAVFGPPEGWTGRAALFVGALRADLAAAILDAAPGRGGAIAVALIAGDESRIAPEDREALFASGIGHLISVSGLHMAVVGGLVFGGLSLFFALIAPIALRWPVKKLAAAGALLALGGYLVISGSSVPAIRAFVMACVAFGAILIDRPAISMRGLALAALIVVLIFPESVLEPGFQMSFAATAALVAAFEANKRPPDENALPTPGPLIGGLQWLARTGGAILLTSLVAGLATDAFALFHFQRFAAYGLVANFAIAPLVTFVVAPAAAIAAIAAPFGLAEWPLAVMAEALDLIAAIGTAFGVRPEAVQAFPRPPDLFLPLASMGVLWACLWRGALRWGGALWFGAAFALYLAAPAPALAFDGEMRAVYARAGDAWTLNADGRRSTFARQRLGGQLGLTPRAVERLAPPEGCAEAFCAWTTPQGRSAFAVRDAALLERACLRGAIVLTLARAPPDFSARCAPLLLIDAASLAAEGGGLITERADGVRVARAQPRAVARVWTARAQAAEN